MKDTTNALVRISELDMGHGLVKTVDARELHKKLGVAKDFSNWVKNQIARCKFVEGRDFVVFAFQGENPSGGRPSLEYAFTLYAAKHISMMSGTDKGFEIRDYFIQVEEDYSKQIQTIPHAVLEDLSILKFRMKELETFVKGTEKATIDDYANSKHIRGLNRKRKAWVGTKLLKASLRAGHVPPHVVSRDPHHTVRSYPMNILQENFMELLEQSKHIGEKPRESQTVLPFEPAGK